MDTPVYKLWLAKPTLETVSLPQEQMDSLFEKHNQFVKEQGVRDLVSGTIWSDENYTNFGVELFPNWKAVRDFHRCLDEIHWFQRWTGFILLGVDQADNPNKLEPVELKPGEEWFAQIYLARELPALYSVTEAEMAEGMKVMGGVKAMGVRDLVQAHSLPISEEWNDWGVNLIPSMEVLMRKTQAQQQIHWWKSIEARTYLGSAEGGELIKK